MTDSNRPNNKAVQKYMDIDWFAVWKPKPNPAQSVGFSSPVKCELLEDWTINYLLITVI